MSDRSEEDLFDYDKGTPDRSPAVDDDQGDPEVPLRDEDPDQDKKSDPSAQGPAGEDLDDAGYGGDDALGNEDVEENKDDYGNFGEDEENVGEIQYEKGGDVYNFDEMEDDGEGRGKRKKKARREKARSGSTKKKVKYDDMAEEVEGEEEEEMKKSKSKGKRRKEEEADESEIAAIIQSMDKAYNDDLRALGQKKPALNKLQLLPEVERVLKRGVNQRAFLNYQNEDGAPHGLLCFRKWLSKNALGALPSLQIKKSLVEVLYQLPITEDNLRTSDIGKVIYSMRNNPNENPDLRKQVRDLVDKWTRVVTDQNDYGLDDEEFRDRKKITVSLDDYRQQSMSSLRKSIPRMVNKRSGYDFMRRPPTEGTSRNPSVRQQANEECDKLIKEMKRKMKKAF